METIGYQRYKDLGNLFQGINTVLLLFFQET